MMMMMTQPRGRRHHFFLLLLLILPLLATASPPALFSFDAVSAPPNNDDDDEMAEDGGADPCSSARSIFGQACERCSTITLNPLVLGEAIVRIPSVSQVENDDILLGLEHKKQSQEFVYRYNDTAKDKGVALFAVFVTTERGVTGNIPAARGFTHIAPCRTLGVFPPAPSSCHTLTQVVTSELDDTSHGDTIEIPTTTSPTSSPNFADEEYEAAAAEPPIMAEDAGAGDAMCARGYPTDDMRYCCETPSSLSCVAQSTSRSCFSYSAPCYMVVVQTVSVAYSPLVKLTTADINGLVQLAISETNQAYLKSQIPIQLQLDGMPYLKEDVVEDGNANAMLTHFKQSTNAKQKVHPNMRMLIVSSTRSCGIAYLDCTQYSEYTCYAMVQASCATGYYSFAHELGHLQGANHNMEMSGVDGKDNHGLVMTKGYGAFGAYRTVMAYNIEDELRIAYFSNPAVVVEGKSTGLTGVANNARVLRASRYAIARAIQLSTLEPTTQFPTSQFPTLQPTFADPTLQPISREPSYKPTLKPVELVTLEPTQFPTFRPTKQPTTPRPSQTPTFRPTMEPTWPKPTQEPTFKPTAQPITRAPTAQPTFRPTLKPSTTLEPTLLTEETTILTLLPTFKPTARPTMQPTFKPTKQPTTRSPTVAPTEKPTKEPTTRSPTSQPTPKPTKQPTVQPTRKPTDRPSVWPTKQPTLLPTREPVAELTNQPTEFPTWKPTRSPSTVMLPPSPPVFTRFPTVENVYMDEGRPMEEDGQRPPTTKHTTERDDEQVAPPTLVERDGRADDAGVIAGVLTTLFLTAIGAAAAVFVWRRRHSSPTRLTLRRENTAPNDEGEPSRASNPLFAMQPHFHATLDVEEQAAHDTLTPHHTEVGRRRSSLSVVPPHT